MIQQSHVLVFTPNIEISMMKRQIPALPLKSVAMLFTTGKSGSQCKCPLTDEWVKKVWHIHSGILLNLKRERNSVASNNTELENIVLRGKRQPQRDKTSCSHLCAESKTVEPLTQNGVCASWEVGELARWQPRDTVSGGAGGWIVELCSSP